ncbi:MAG: type IV secretion system protein [Bacteroidetes bacterium]|nr:type IV secretion system protein [Bacteroidota bacterium]MCY4233819.1 type IV secretion system protein [Bacteroidota bacterium]
MQQALQNCAPTMFFDCAQEVFRLTTEAWLTRALDAAQTLFLSLAVLEIVVTGYMIWAGRRKQGDDLISQFAFKIGLLAFVLGLLSTYHKWLPLIAQGFGETAVYIGGSSVTHLSPTHLLNIGLSMLLSVMQSVGLTSGFITSLALIPALIMLLCFVALAAHLLVTMIESYVVVTGGLFFVGFMAFRGTAPLGEGYLKYVVYIGIKLFFIILIAGVAASIGDDMVELLQSYNHLWLASFEQLFSNSSDGSVTSRMGFLWSMTAVSILLAGLGLHMPGRIASQLSQGISINFKRALQNL